MRTRRMTATSGVLRIGQRDTNHYISSIETAVSRSSSEGRKVELASPATDLIAAESELLLYSIILHGYIYPGIHTGYHLRVAGLHISCPLPLFSLMPPNRFAIDHGDAYTH